jgi:prepilin peptidase CpaA
MATGIWCLSFLILNLLVAISDFRFHRVPNKWLVATLTAQAVWLFLVWQGIAISRVGASGWDQALAGLSFGLILFYPLWRFRAVGAGDVKFIATLAFVLGLDNLFPVLLIGTAACGIHGLGVVLLVGWMPARNMWRSGSPTRRGVPYAAYLALAAIAWMVWQVSQGSLLVATGG